MSIGLIYNEVIIIKANNMMVLSYTKSKINQSFLKIYNFGTYTTQVGQSLNY